MDNATGFRQEQLASDDNDDDDDDDDDDDLHYTILTYRSDAKIHPCVFIEAP